MILNAHVPRTYVAKLDALVEQGEFSTTSDAVTRAIRLLISKHEEEYEDE